MRKERAQDIYYGVVDPMDCYAGQDAPRAVIHPAEKQTYEEGVEHLGRIKMDYGEHHGRYQYGHPRMREAAEKRLEDGAAEHGLLNKRNQQAEHKIAILAAHKQAK